MIDINEATIVKKIIEYVVKNKDKIILKTKAATYYRTKDVRMSLSYLFSIEIDNKYLLVKGNRIDQYQPIGGVYQYTNSFDEVKRHYQIRNASNDHFYNNKDLRIVVPGKNVPKVVEWFHSKHNRETEQRREFIEELVEKGPLDILDYDESIKDFIKCEETKLVKSTYFAISEYNIYEIYKLILTENAKEKLRNYMLKNKDFILVNAEDIKKENVLLDGLAVKIGAHGKYTI